MRRMMKRVAAVTVSAGLSVSLSMTALAQEIGPGFEPTEEETIDGPRFPGDTEYLNEENENTEESQASEEGTGETAGEQGNTQEGTSGGEQTEGPVAAPETGETGGQESSGETGQTDSGTSGTRCV